MARYPDGYTMDLTGQLVPIAPANPRSLTRLQFMARLSEAEQVALNVLRISPDTPLDVRGALETLKETRDNTEDNRINLDDPRVARGVGIALSVLAALPDGIPGKVDPADIPSRTVAWLADFPQPGELP